ncbi:MAG: Holliday junction resolvase RuvX [Nitrospinae bacterium]|nr:Holliday junction resolvase RuvX [Nitrospinota bacterium]
MSVGRILGLDIGDVVIGISVSDELGLTAQGLNTLKRKGIRSDFRYIKGLIDEYNICEVVVGLPKNMDGRLGPQAEKVIDFVERLRSEISLSVVTWDERLTTVAAENVLIDANISRKKRKGLADKIASQLILQGYLDSKRYSCDSDSRQ